MSNTNLKIKTYTITNFFMDFDSIPNGQHQLSFEVNMNLMTPKDDETKDSIVIIGMIVKEENDKIILSAKLRGYANLPEGLSEMEKPEILKSEAAPIFYENLRSFVEDTMKKTNTDFTNLIPHAEDMDFE